MRRLSFLLVVAAGAVALPLGAGAAVSPSFRLAIAHTVSGCHTWMHDTKTLGPAAKIVVKPGTKLQIRLNCPMDFDVRQIAGPRLALGDARSYAGTVRTISFRKAGLYRLAAKNVQSSVERNLTTLGPDNQLSLTVVVR
jgi:hypothetical protein